MAASGNFGCSKITFDCISSHFRSISHFGSLKFTFDSNSGHFRSIQNLMVFFGGHFGCPKITFDRISGHFWSIGHILDVQNSLSMAFLAISDFVFELFWQNGRRRPFWIGRQCQLSNLSEIFGWIMHVSSLKKRSLIPSKVIALTTKLWRGGRRRGGGGCVADENIIFPKTYVSREYNYTICNTCMITGEDHHSHLLSCIIREPCGNY